MSAPENAASPDNLLAFAGQLFQKYRIQCFWHLRPDLEITEATIPTIVDGLRKNGNRETFLEAARLARLAGASGDPGDKKFLSGEPRE